mmetsp:Transcript_58669/g.155149  ORF Transcript_58669/g.155149 Transcript_58669/m.155149 type:complete len:215 (+) Transcript_58669:613-1257(+)
MVAVRVPDELSLSSCTDMVDSCALRSTALFLADSSPSFDMAAVQLTPPCARRAEPAPTMRLPSWVATMTPELAPKSSNTSAYTAICPTGSDTSTKLVVRGASQRVSFALAPAMPKPKLYISGPSWSAHESHDIMKLSTMAAPLFTQVPSALPDRQAVHLPPDGPSFICNPSELLPAAAPCPHSAVTVYARPSCSSPLLGSTTNTGFVQLSAPPG